MYRQSRTQYASQPYPTSTVRLTRATSAQLSEVYDAIKNNDMYKLDSIMKLYNLSDVTFMPNGENALHYAVMFKRYDMAKKLMEHGCHINLKNLCGFTPLDLATFHNDTCMIRLLLDNNGELNKLKMVNEQLNSDNIQLRDNNNELKTLLICKKRKIEELETTVKRQKIDYDKLNTDYKFVSSNLLAMQKRQFK